MLKRYLFFTVANIQCGIPVENAQCMLRMVSITPQTSAKKENAGTINLHGRTVPVYSLRSLFGFLERKPLLTDNLIIIKSGADTVAFWVDETDIVQPGEIMVDTRFTSESIQTIIPGIRIIRTDLVILSDIRNFLEYGIHSPTKLGEILKSDNTMPDELTRSFTVRDYNTIEMELQKRASELSLPEIEEEKPPLKEVIRFNLMYQEYAIEMKYIREVIQTSEITPVPGTPDFIAGICSVRSEIISLVDLRILLSIPDKGLTDLNRVIVLSDCGNKFGILADQITGIGVIKTDDIKKCNTQGNPVWNQYCQGMIDSLIVLDAASLLTDPRMIIDDSEA
ncbi:MAG: chemotaxis protein CheW [Methanomicrobiales archaeon]|nr:chemotaxis protein CheW [Methanomicrobiales archaeon]